MDHREWIVRTVGHEETGAVPYNFDFTPAAERALRSHCGTEDIEGLFEFPIRTWGTSSVKPLYADPEEFGATATDEFGVVWTTSPIDRGLPVGPPLAEAALADYTFPDPAAGYRFEGISEWCRDNSAHYTIMWVGDLWERATFMRGMENLLLDTAMKPSFVEALLRGLADYVLETMKILLAQGGFDCVALSDDYGTQKAMLISPAQWRRFVKPLLREVFDLAKANGRATFLHSCGNVTEIVGDLIDVGLDILHPIQPEAMDIEHLKREFGWDLAFCGGLGTQELLPRGTPDEVRAEVRRLKETMGKGGGYILEPGITIQADVPAENMIAMIEEARRRE